MHRVHQNLISFNASKQQTKQPIKLSTDCQCTPKHEAIYWLKYTLHANVEDTKQTSPAHHNLCHMPPNDLLLGNNHPSFHKIQPESFGEFSSPMSHNPLHHSLHDAHGSRCCSLMRYASRMPHKSSPQTPLMTPSRRSFAAKNFEL